mmetsp:Transcript_49414/g.67345  ORF Transcript_49414/g.67345 Transcript_49414/m.67345 type:complete len:88 (+) Transcript_49414:104-367(+)
MSQLDGCLTNATRQMQHARSREVSTEGHVTPSHSSDVMTGAVKNHFIPIQLKAAQQTVPSFLPHLVIERFIALKKTSIRKGILAPGQ